jgi:hypothetical protein
MSSERDEPQHALNCAYERLGDDNMVVIRCAMHPGTIDAYYTWPTQQELLATGKKHDPEYDWSEHYRWH